MSNVYTEFGKVKDTILQDISNVKSKSQVNDVKIKIRLLTEFVLKEISAIPAHDLKYYTSEVTRLNTLIDETSAKFQTKFSFNRRNLAVKQKPEGGVLSRSLPQVSKREYKDLANQVIRIPQLEESIHFENVTSSTITVGTRCTVGDPHASALHFKQCLDVLVCAEIEGSVYLDEVNDSKLQLKCQQLRIHNSVGTQFKVDIPSNQLVIENSKALTFYHDGPLTVNDFSLPNKDKVNPNYTIKLGTNWQY